MQELGSLWRPELTHRHTDTRTHTHTGWEGGREYGSTAGLRVAVLIRVYLCLPYVFKQAFMVFIYPLNGLTSLPRPSYPTAYTV